FADTAALVAGRGRAGELAGVLLDLGVSSPQLDQAERGFSFMNDGPLDMRMDTEHGESAAEWLASAREEDIIRVLRDYGEEKFARRMAAAIVRERALKPITRTRQLAEIVAAANPAWEKGKHPATRAFQAIRIPVTRELAGLAAPPATVLAALKAGGRVVVISLRSRVDRIVQGVIRREEQGPAVPRGLPVREADIVRRLRSVGRAVKADAGEV